MSSGQTEFTLENLAGRLGVEFRGDPSHLFTGLATLSSAQSCHLSVYHNSKYHHDLRETRAGGVILHPDHVPDCSANMLITKQPYPCFALASQLFSNRRHSGTGIHASAQVNESARIGHGVMIGPNVVVSEGAAIGDNCYIGANCVVGPYAEVGNDGWLYPNVTLYSWTKLGARHIIHSGTVIGSDGFGFAYDGNSHLKIEQMGCVVIGEDVEIGANTTIDRGALDDTIIGNGVKIDNQVQIAHNVVVGDNTVICGCSAVAGSAKIGANCIIAGAVGIINHITIVDGVTVTAMTLVNQDIRKPGVYSSGTGMSETGLWKRNVVRFRELDAMAKKLKTLSSDKDEH